MLVQLPDGKFILDFAGMEGQTIICLWLKIRISYVLEVRCGIQRNLGKIWMQ